MAKLPGCAEVVVVGGGVLGCSVAYHLAKSGVTDVLLLERDRLGSGTDLAFGGQHHLEAGRHQRRHGALCLRPVGCLARRVRAGNGMEVDRPTLPRSKPGGDGTLSNLAAQAEEAGLDAPLLTPKPPVSRNPLIDPATLAGAWYNPRSGRVDPANYTAALARAAARRGASIVEACTVQTLEANGGKVSAVLTEQGRVETETVVLCAGLLVTRSGIRSGPAAGAMADRALLRDCRAGRWRSRDMPSFFCPENLIYGREEVGGCFGVASTRMPR